MSFDIESANYRLMDLLDLYRDECMCVQYNGWFRRRHPDDIRSEIDQIIKELIEGYTG